MNFGMHVSKKRKAYHESRQVLVRQLFALIVLLIVSTIMLILSDHFQRIWEKAVTGNGGKLCNGDIVISDRFLR